MDRSCSQCNMGIPIIGMICNSCQIITERKNRERMTITKRKTVSERKLLDDEKVLKFEAFSNKDFDKFYGIDSSAKL